MIRLPNTSSQGTQAMRNEVIVYALPFLEERHMARGDVAGAITRFKEKTGKEARLINLNPKNEKFAREAPDGVTVAYVGGCLAWEVWLSAEMKEFIGGAASAATEDRSNNSTDTGEKQASAGATVPTRPAAREITPASNFVTPQARSNT